MLATNNTRLSDAIGFTEDDLAANRDGYMSKPQRNQLSHERAQKRLIRIGIGVVAVSVLIFLFLDGLHFHDTFFSTRSAVGIATGILASAALIVLSVWVGALNGDLYKGHVASVEGYVSLEIVLTDKNKNHPLQNLQHKDYLLHIQTFTFKIPKNVYDAFSPDCIYRVSYTSGIERLLAGVKNAYQAWATHYVHRNLPSLSRSVDKVGTISPVYRIYYAPHSKTLLSAECLK
jgi:hypothetical protein